MSSDFHVQPRELNLRTLHCLFDQSHVALQCSRTCIPTCFISMFSFSAKHNVLKFSFQILMRRGILFFSILLWRCGLLLAFRLRDPGVLFCGRSSKSFSYYVLMPPSRRTRLVAAGEPVNIPADLDLDSLFVKDLRTLCSQLSLPTAGTRSALVDRLKEARETRQNAQSIGAPPPVQNGGDNIELQQHFQQLQQQVQDLLNRNSSDERMLSESQLTQVKSLVQATINETIEQTAAAAAQAAVNAFTGSSPSSQAVVPERKASSEGNVPFAVQETLNSTAVNGTSGNDINSISSTSQQTLDSVHELPPKLVKEILSGEFMELSKLLPKNFNSLQPLHDEPLTLTLENSVIRVNKAKATSITNIEEWTSAFTAYMSVIISKHPSRAAKLLEYLSLIWYAAKYHRGLGWCVYDVKFRQKAAADKFIKWSTIDSQLWLKTFTVAPSLMKEELGFFQSGPSSMPSTVRGNEYRTCHNFNKGFSCARTPCPYAHRCNKPGCRGDHPGIRCPFPTPNQKSNHPHGLGSLTVSTIAPATVASNFGGVVTPVNFFNLQCALHSHPDRVFVNKLCLELREGARIGYSGPR